MSSNTYPITPPIPALSTHELNLLYFIVLLPKLVIILIQNLFYIHICHSKNQFVSFYIFTQKNKESISENHLLSLFLSSLYIIAKAHILQYFIF